MNTVYECVDYRCDDCPRLMSIEEVKQSNGMVFLEEYGLLDSETKAFWAGEAVLYHTNDRHHAAFIPVGCTSESQMIEFHWTDYNQAVDGGWRCWTDAPWRESPIDDDDTIDVSLQRAPWRNVDEYVSPDWQAVSKRSISYGERWAVDRRDD